MPYEILVMKKRLTVCIAEHRGKCMFALRPGSFFFAIVEEREEEHMLWTQVGH